MRNKLIAFTLAAALALLAAGCMEQAADEVSETVSQAKSELENAGSRLEEAGSRVGSAVESMLDPDSSRKEESSATLTPQPREGFENRRPGFFPRPGLCGCREMRQLFLFSPFLRARQGHAILAIHRIF